MFFQSFDFAFNSSEIGDSSIDYTFKDLVALDCYRLLTSATDPVELSAHLKRLMAASVLVFNPPFLVGENGGLHETEGYYSGALANPEYRVKNPLLGPLTWEVSS